MDGYAPFWIDKNEGTSERPPYLSHNEYRNNGRRIPLIEVDEFGGDWNLALLSRTYTPSDQQERETRKEATKLEVNRGVERVREKGGDEGKLPS